MPKEIVLDLGENKENKLKAYAPWIAALAVIAVVITASGFYLGRWDGEQNFFGLDKQKNISPTREGWLVIEGEKFYIEYPETWKIEETEGSTKILKESGQIEFWTGSLREHRLTKEQNAKAKSTKQSELEIDGRKGQLVETSFKSGEFFLSIRLPANKDKPKVTFWIAVNDEETKKEALEIIKTFKGG